MTLWGPKYLVPQKPRTVTENNSSSKGIKPGGQEVGGEEAD